MTQAVHSSPPRRLNFQAATDAAVTVPAAGNTTLLEMDISQVARVAAEIKNTGANAFDAFIVSGKVAPDGDWLTLLSAAADFTSPAGIVVDASGDLTTLAGGGTGWLILDVLGFNKLRIQASGATGGTSATVKAGGA